MARRPEGPPPPPAVQRLRLRFAKRGRLRFTSHRDFQRAFERAIRRAGVPIAYSAGFSPHPKVSYAGAAPTGVGSEAEYLELALAEVRDPEAVRAGLDAALPAGFDVLEAVVAGPGTLADRLEASVWEIVLEGVAPAEAEAAVGKFLAAEAVEVERLTKGGMRTFDARAAVLSAVVAGAAPGGAPAGAASREPEPSGCAVPPAAGVCAILQVVVRHVTPAVRPDDVLSGLRRVADLAPPRPPRVTRLAQGPLDTESDGVLDPLAPDRLTAGSAEGSAPDQAQAQAG
jgi:radical SAM-linked protein